MSALVISTSKPLKMKRTAPFSRQLRQFTRLSKKINQLQESGKLTSLSPATRNRLVQKLNASFHRLKRVHSPIKLQHILAGAGLLIGLGTTGVQEANAQGFIAPVVNPYGLMPDSATYAFVAAADMDNDGDLDLFSGSSQGQFDYFQNTGTATAPAFGTPQINPFGLTTAPYGNFLTIADMDGDGDYDLLTGNGYGYGDLTYWQNTGTATTPAFGTPVTPAFGLNANTFFAIVDLVDIDGDGDMDLFVGTSANNLVYFQNTGTAMAPSFATGVTNPFGLTVSTFPPAGAFGDVDQDGDMDLIIADTYNDFRYFQNTGTSTAPAFAASVTNPFGITNLGTFSPIFPALIDIDGDSDLDLFVGDEYSRIWVYQDTTLSSNAAPILSAPANDTICSVDSFGPEPFTASDPEGDSLTITAISTNQAVIMDANISLSGTAPNYTISATPSGPGLTSLIITADDGNLQSSDTLEIEVEVCNTAPQVVAPANDTICDFDDYGPAPFTASDPENDPLMVTAVSSNQTVIMDANITISGTAPNYTIEATPSGQGSTTLTITADDGTLQTTDTHDIFVDNCVGIEENWFVEHFALYPNPAQDQVRLELSLLDPADNLTYELFSAMGKKVKGGHISGNRTEFREEIDLTGLSRGFYTLRVHTGTLQLSRTLRVD